MPQRHCSNIPRAGTGEATLGDRLADDTAELGPLRHLGGERLGTPAKSVA